VHCCPLVPHPADHPTGLSVNTNRTQRELDYQIEDDFDHQTAAGANSNLLAISQVCNSYFEAIATRAGIVVDLESLIEGHVFDLDLIVYVEVVCHVEAIVWYHDLITLVARSFETARRELSAMRNSSSIT
jgi:hypothetical protein